MDILIIALFLLFGIILLLVEIFFLPGITIAGIAGIAFLIGGIVYAFSVDTTYGIYTMIVAAIALGFAIWYFMRSKILDKISLHAEVDGKIETFDATNIKIGDKGVAISRLAPIGKVKINGITVEAKSFFDFIDEDTEIEVVAVNSTNVVVKIPDNENLES